MANFGDQSNSVFGFMKKVMIMNRSLLNTVLFVSLTSVVYIYPFGSYFRFTLAIILLTTFLLYFEQLSVLLATSITGFVILLFRTTVDHVIGGHGYGEAFFSNVPSLAYYISFGLLFHLLGIRKYRENGLLLILLLSVTDIVSNVIELLFRSELIAAKFKVIFPSVVAVAVVRSVLAYLGYYALKQYKSFILANEHAKRYIEQTIVVAKLKSELFYLEKSSQDIENVMEKAYWLYKQLNSKEHTTEEGKVLPADQALAVAREIHEVKKDYYRVITGIGNILRPSSRDQQRTLSEILFIIEQNTIRFLAGIDREIHVSYEQEEDFITDKHYTLVSILDNLIMNAIEACGAGGIIQVIQRSVKEEIVFSVEDNGSGIHDKDFDLIFNPGYSTKFSPRTGKISTGLGLAHVKDYVDLLGGTIRVESRPGIYTKFIISLPSASLILATGGELQGKQ